MKYIFIIVMLLIIYSPIVVWTIDIIFNKLNSKK